MILLVMRGSQPTVAMIKRRVRDLRYVFTGKYRSFDTSLGLSFERLGIPPTQLSVDGKRILFTCDFLPDRHSFSGIPFQDSPHSDFVQRYLTDSRFDYRDTNYFKLAVNGHLPFPCYGKAQAESRCRKFVGLVDRIRKNGHQSDKFSPMTLVECIDGGLMIINGKHRLAAYLALGIHEFPAVVCHDNEVRALYHDVQNRSWPEGFYRKSLETLEKVGRPLKLRQAAIASLIRKIKDCNLEARSDVYHPIPFYEFRNLSTQVDCQTPYQRLAMILSGYQDLPGMWVFDMGCNVGFYSFSLARRGANVIGVDLNPQYIDIATTAALIYDVPTTFLNAQITPEFIRHRKEHLDITLCFSVLQSVIAQEGMDFGLEVLKAVSEKSDALFFDIPVNTGKACLTCSPGDEIGFVERLLRESTTYRYIRNVGDVHPYITDTRHVFYCSHRKIPEPRNDSMSNVVSRDIH